MRRKKTSPHNRGLNAANGGGEEFFMKITDAIAAADELRINSISDEQKTRWVHELDCRIAEAMGKEFPAWEFPSERELLMPVPYEDIYVTYLVAMIDHCNGEGELYVNDMAVFDNKYSLALGWWIRNNRPASKGNWRV